MKSFFFTVIFSIIYSLTIAQVNPNYHYVNGYTRKDGTYVKGHYRTNSNSTNTDNYSTKPNVNPWTGKPGTVQPNRRINSPNTNYIVNTRSTHYSYKRNTISERTR